ncbi:uncharacterized protein [Rutidosis leptorrhynchoides]|uniref:uncharacterized protein n=1 Tax=Rutidosis leptorrhynchoides TaxID=125765 RepID=UPI003A998DB4
MSSPKTDYWNIIIKGDYVPFKLGDDRKTKIFIPEEEWYKEHKVDVGKNYEAKMTIFNALPRKEYETVFMMDYEKIDSAYTIFNNICSSLKALGTIYTDKQYVRKFLRALPSIWRPKVTAINESKNAEKLTLDELIGNLKLHEVILDKDDEVEKAKREKNKSIALNAKIHEEYDVEDDDDDILNDEEQLAFIVLSFKKFYRRPGNHVRPPMEPKKTQFDSKKKFVRNCFGCGDTNHLISECPKRKNGKAFLGGTWDDEENDTQEEGKETYLMAIDNPIDDDEASQVGQIDNEVLSNTFEFNVDNFVKLCVLSNRVSNNNTSLKEENNLLRLEILQLKERISNSQECLTCDYLKHENLVLNKANKLLENRIKFSKYDGSSKVLENILNVQKPKNNKQEESLDVTFNETPPPPKTKPLEDDDVIELDAIEIMPTQVGSNEINEDGSHLKPSKDNLASSIDLKHVRDHSIEQVIGDINTRTTRYQMGLDEDGNVVRRKARLFSQGYSQQEGIDYDETFAPVASL